MVLTARVRCYRAGGWGECSECTGPFQRVSAASQTRYVTSRRKQIVCREKNAVHYYPFAHQNSLTYKNA